MGLQRSIVDDDTGVSPVIGVILMVAVTVIIGAIISSSALELGDSVIENPPQAQIGIEIVDDYPVEKEGGPTEEFKAVKLTHDGGGSISQENIKVTVDGKPAHATAGPGTDPAGDGWPALIEPWQNINEITAGDEAILLSSGTYVEDAGLTTDPNKDRTIYKPDDGNNTIIWLGDTPGGGSSERTIDEGDDYMLEEAGEELRVVWESDDQSQTLFEGEIQ